MYLIGVINIKINWGCNLKKCMVYSCFCFLFVLLCGTYSFADDKIYRNIPSEYSSMIDLSEKEGNIPIKIKTRNVNIWVYPCGEVRKEVAEVLNDNEEFATHNGSTWYIINGEDYIGSTFVESD